MLVTIEARYERPSLPNHEEKLAIDRLRRHLDRLYQKPMHDTWRMYGRPDEVAGKMDELEELFDGLGCVGRLHLYTVGSERCHVFAGGGR